MTAHILNSQGTQVVFGLDWMPLTGEQSEQDEVRLLAASTNAAYQVRHASEHAIVYGFLNKENVPEQIKKPEFVSATMLLATFPDVARNAIWVEVEAQTAKVAVLENGDPSPAGDFFGPLEHADEIIQRIQSDAGEIFTIYGNYTEVYPHSIPLQLSDLIAEGNVVLASLAKASKGINRNVVVLGVLAALLAGGLLYYDHMAEDARVNALAAKRKKPTVDTEKLYRETLRQAILSAGVPASAAADVLMGSWQNVETLQAGWTLKEVNCDVTACIYTWSVLGGTNASLKQALGDLPYQFSLAGTEVTYSLPNAKKTSVSLQLQALPTFGAFNLTAGSVFQQLRMVEVNVHVDPPTIFGAGEGVNVQALKAPIRTGRIVVEGAAALLPEVFSHLPDSVTFKTLQVTPKDGEPKFKLEGNYYVQN